MRNITLGQYFPGESPIHRMDPRIKIVLTMVYIVILLMAAGPIAYAVVFVTLAAIIIMSRINFRVIMRSMRPLLFIIAFTAILSIFYTPGEPLVRFWGLTITREGAITAVYMVLRIAMLIAGTFVLLTYTTSPIMLTDGIESLLRPLQKFRVPVHELAMMMTIALRMIPTLIEETDKIIQAQKARGADFESGNIMRRAKALVPILIPLFVSAFRRAEELAVAMECRCYRGGTGRTRLRQLHMVRLDYATIALSLFVSAAILFATYAPL